MFIDSIAAMPSTERPDNFLKEVDAIMSIPMIEDQEEVARLSEEEGFRKVFEYFFAGVINRAMGFGDEKGIEGNSLTGDYMSRLYSEEMAQSLIADVNFKNLIAIRSFTDES